MHAITPRQLQILQFVRDYRHRNGYSPTLDEIGEALDITKVTVFEHVVALIKKGLAKRGARHSARSLLISPDVQFPDERPTRIPLAGRIAAGQPIEAVEDRQALDIEAMFDARRGETFALRVRGNSMIDEHIRDGDYVVCRRTSTARNGDTVVALLADGEATLKKFYREKGRIRLQPASDQFAPIYPDKIDIQGVVIGVIRKL